MARGQIRQEGAMSTLKIPDRQSQFILSILIVLGVVLSFVTWVRWFRWAF